MYLKLILVKYCYHGIHLYESSKTQEYWKILFFYIKGYYNKFNEFLRTLKFSMAHHKAYEKCAHPRCPRKNSRGQSSPLWMSRVASCKLSWPNHKSGIFFPKLWLNTISEHMKKNWDPVTDIYHVANGNVGEGGGSFWVTKIPPGGHLGSFHGHIVSHGTFVYKMMVTNY